VGINENKIILECIQFKTYLSELDISELNLIKEELRSTMSQKLLKTPIFNEY